jgi:propanol-preferring alcohol dehydrogenase
MPTSDTMLAMVLENTGEPLRERRLPLPVPGPHQVLLRVTACGVCRTDLHIVDGELPAHKLPLIPGHQAVGVVAALGPGAHRFALGARIGVPWLAASCGHCMYCSMQRENLCDTPAFTGYDRDGGYAEFMLADQAFCFHLPERYDDLHAAPMLCAGLIGYRAYAMAGDALRIGLYGFGAAAHIICQLARYQGRQVLAFTRAGDLRTQGFALSLGAVWAGDADARAPLALDAAIIFAPAGELVPRALAAIRKGGTVVCAGIHMSQIPAFAYSLLWGERCVRSVANLTRADGEQFFALASRYQIRTVPVPFALRDANAALAALRAGSFDGAAVLLPGA